MARKFRSLRGDPLPSYDAVIIGAGVGGLVCANLLVRAGLQVLVIEQHYMVGGYCSTFKRKGFVFDAATHFYPLLGNPRTLTGKVLVELGLKTSWIKMDPVDQFHFPDGTKFTVPADFDNYVARLKREFPEEERAIDDFFLMARRVYLLGLVEYFRGRPTHQLDPYRKASVQDILDTHFRNNKLKLVLTGDTGHWGSPPRRTSFVFDSMLRLAYFLGNYYPKGGSQAFVDDLAASFEAAGGHILMSSLVTRIHVRGQHACGVETETGVGSRRKSISIDAGVVVSNADLRRTITQLLAPGCIDPAYLGTLNKLRPTLPCFVTHIGLRGISTNLLEEIQGYHWSSWDPNDVATNAFKIFVPTLFDREIAPPDGHILVVQKITDIDYSRVDDWAAHKASVEEYICKNLNGIIPGFSDHVVVKLSASALTSFRYTLNHHGAMLGWELAPDQVGDDRPGVIAPLKNLYLVGHWTQPGGGITPVMVSAMRAAEVIGAGRCSEIVSTPLSIANRETTPAVCA